MFYVYILRSLKTGKLYYGYSENVLTRLSWHNAGAERYTKSGIPWELLHQECYETKAEALKRERYLKKLKTLNTFLKILSEILIRVVAQPGSAFPWGGKGRKFKSCPPDFFNLL